MGAKRILRGDHASKDEPGIVSSLLEIQQCRIPQQKMIWIVENLECLGRRQSKKRKLTDNEDDEHKTPYWFRKDVNGFTDSNFVALSYTWDASEHETQNPKDQGHLIETRDGQEAWRSSVRNSVLERITKYMQCHDVPLLWIDRHSIPQKKCKQPACSHAECKQKRHALDAMDRVYSLSDHPVALLGRPIRDADEMMTLSSILKGTLVKYYEGSSALSKGAEHKQAQKMLHLLYEITSDKWWTRAWTFQENYRAGLKMTLLIHHESDLEETKRSIRSGQKPMFGTVPGELSVQSVKFSESATKFCLGFRRHHFKTSDDEEKINYILTTAGKYTLLLPSSNSMSGIIVSDVKARGATEQWDRLAIIANCCQYATRLNSMRLQQSGESGPSLDLSILALRLLNGEILKNDEPSTAHGTVIDRMNDLFFDNFQAPEGERRTRLRQLVELVKARKGRKKEAIVDDMKDFLEEDAFVVDEDGSFSLRYRRLMAKELVRAMDADQPLLLGYLCDPFGEPTTARAIFIPRRLSDEVDELWSRERHEPTHVFTSLWSDNHTDEEYLGNDLDHHVSLGVRLSNDDYEGPVQVYTGEWVLGLCFFEGAATYDVVFPWPQALVQ
ncbi:hypothetical protein FSARC_519 [Fusarium sarcochroum]|uniref:Heterokaryon incompatibility domain-containing protein n=1 Tax=Fusarium sarcochroum TaxID=1208366 RepID=A0A8H4UBU2_9HYPO|nr:hypothetical protein FSARC_519 [Fusarium sarcochroum]